MALDPGVLDRLRHAARAIERLEAQLAASERFVREPIAIIGMGCRFPGASSPEDYWQLLRAGGDAVGEVPPSRWDAAAWLDADPAAPGKMYSARVATVDGLEAFDGALFGIAPRESLAMDPQQRLLLEVAWEALEDAGRDPLGLTGSPTGVFVGLTSSGYGERQLRALGAAGIDRFLATGSVTSVAAGRLAYTLGLQGPCAALDTACSSSLVAVHLAAASLRSGECDLAIAGGVNAVLSPEVNVALCKAGMLAPDGRCKVFSQGADGYVRGEGCGLVVLRRLSDAVASGDRIHAVLRGSAINQDGRSNGLTAPNGLAQQAVIRRALTQARVDPAQVDFVEAHGSGTELGDPIEVEALGAVYGKREAAPPLLLGAVKANIGHLESAAGIAGLIKAVLCLRHGEVPPQIHISSLNAHIPWSELPVAVPREPTRLQPRDGCARAGVSSFGFSGTNAHAILEAPPAEQRTAAGTAPPPPPYVLPLAARTPAALSALCERYAAHFAARPELDAADACHSAAVGRAHLPCRRAAVGSSAQALREALARAPELPPQGEERQGPPRIAFLFTGQGAQSPGMGRGLHQAHPVFRDALERCAAELAPYMDRPLFEVLFPSVGDEALIHQTQYAQPALFAFEYASMELWRSWGVVPDAVLGHSVGEFAAACAAGVFTLEGAARVIAERGRLMQSLPEGGAMAAVRAGPEAVAAALEACGSSASIAAFNGPAETVITGELAAVMAASDALARAGLQTKPLTVSHAFHSRLLDPMLDDFERVVERVPLAPPRSKLISNLTGELAGAELATAASWRRHAREPVRFGDGLRSLQRLGINVLVEVGPHPALLAIAASALPSGTAALVPWLRRGKDDCESAARALAHVYELGATVDWHGVWRPYQARTVDLPKYPFQHAPHPLPKPRLLESAPGAVSGHPLLAERLDLPHREVAFKLMADPARMPFLEHHRVHGALVAPGAFHLSLALHAARELLGEGPCGVEDVLLPEPLVLEPAAEVRLSLRPIDGREALRLELHGRSSAQGAGWRHHSTGVVRRATQPAPREAADELAQVRSRCTRSRAVDDAYRELAERGLEFGPSFRWIAELWTGDGEALARVERPAGVERLAGAVHPGQLDSCFQVLGAALEALEPGPAPIPFGLERIDLFEPLDGPLWCHAKARSKTSSAEWSGDLSISDERGRVLLDVVGLRVRRVDTRAFSRRSGARLASLCEARWHPRPLAAPNATPDTLGRLGIVAETGRDASALTEELTRLGYQAVALERGASLEGTSHLLLVVAGLPSPLGEKGPLSPALAERVEAALEWIRAALRTAGTAPVAPRLVVVTRGAQSLSAGEPAAPAQTAFWGLGRAIAQEHPELRPLLVDLDAGTDLGHPGPDAAALTAELLAGGEESQVAYRASVRHVLRLEQPPAEPHLDAGSATAGSPYRLTSSGHGVLDGLALEPVEPRAPGTGEVRIAVEAWGLNFKDVMIALGVLPGRTEGLGSELTGIITDIGDGVVGLAPGDAVVALTAGAFQSHVVAEARLVAPRPAGLSPEEAATVPMAFLTAWYGLHHLAGLTSSDRVLIHAAAGGVGMAAVQLARRAGAQVFATASPSKWPVLQQMGVEHVMSSRTLDFAREIQERTSGRGVTVVLNSLTGEFVEKSLSLLGPGGRFIEIGKLGLQEPSAVARTHPGVTYRSFDLAEVEPERFQSMLRDVAAAMEAGEVRPLPRRTFPISSAPEAFRCMAKAAHVGKIVLLPERGAEAGAPCSPKPAGTYLVTGGLGALGRHVGAWLASQGVRHLALVSRHAPTEEQRGWLERLQDRTGVEARWFKADVASAEELEVVLGELQSAMPPLRGVIHAAGVLDDGAALSLTSEQVQRVLRPKVDGAWNLHRATRHLPLEHFVLFSSLASLLGSRGQSAYAAANGFLDGLAHLRRSQGLCGLSINWGAWAGEGMAAGVTRGARQGWEALGMAPMRPEEGLRLLELAWGRASAQLGALDVDWNVVAHQLAARGAVPALLSELVTAPRRPPPAPVDRASADLAACLQAASSEERRSLLRGWFKERAARTMGLAGPEDVSTSRSLLEQGFDSLMAVDLRNAAAEALRRPLPATLLFDHPTIDALTECLLTLTSSGVADTLPERPASPKGTSALQPATAASGDDAIAIVGMAFRFPGGVVDADSFWKLLREGGNAVTEVPPERWDAKAWYDPNPDAPGKATSRWMGALTDIDRFDARFFGVAPREARSMDPQQRLLLELAWEALESAGLSSERCAAARTGVFVGLSSVEYGATYVAGDTRRIDPTTGTGNCWSVAAGRLSYLLNLTGPSMALDTACSSSLVALHLACQSLRSGESGLALAGGSSLLLSPESTIAMSKMRALAPDGRCKPFDAAADGYVRSEGCGLVVLERLSDALAHGDPVLALIRGTAVNQDGRSSTLTAPNGQAQRELMEEALRQAGVRPEDVQYVEAHGSGTALGDPIEVQALGEVYCRRRAMDQPLLIGSVKSNLGHMEAAAGVGGLVKTVLALRHGEIPANLHFRQPNPHIPWDRLPVRVPTSTVPWPGDEGTRYAGVSAFGFSGTNAHVVLASFQATASASGGEPAAARAPVDRGQLLALSARSPAALRALCDAYRERLTADDGTSLADLCFSAGARRTHHELRAAAVGATREELREALATARDAAAPLPSDPPTAQVVYVFSGQGSQWLGMGGSLFEREPVFRAAIERCAKALAPWLDWPVLELFAPGGVGAPLDRIDRIQPALFAMQVALAELWRSWGVVPTRVLGHSMGEVAAAHVVGALSLEDAARVITCRSALLRRLAGQGRMLLANVSAARAEALVAEAGVEGGAGVAAYNSVASSVLSGSAEALGAIQAKLKAENVFCRFIDVDAASHSPAVEPLLEELESRLRTIAPKSGEVGMMSTVTGTAVNGAALTPAYWARNLREPVRFTQAVQGLVQEGLTTFVEVSPHPVLLTSIEQDARALGRPATLVASGHRDQREERRVLLEGAAQLFVRGVSLDWSAVTGGHRAVALPRYPFQRERYWAEPPTPRPAETSAGAPATSPLLGRRLDLASADAVFEARPGLASTPWLAEHRLFGVPCYPLGAVLEGALAAAAELGAQGLTVSSLDELSPLFIRGEDTRVQWVASRDGEGALTVRLLARDGERWQPCARARLVLASDATRDTAHGLGPPRPGLEGAAAERAARDFYARAERSGRSYGPPVQVLQTLAVGPDWAAGGLAPAHAGELPLARCVSACLQLQESLGHPLDVALPLAVGPLRVLGDLHSAARAEARREVGPSGETWALEVFDASGRAILEAVAAPPHPVELDRAIGFWRSASEHGVYALDWAARPLEAHHHAGDAERAGLWGIAADPSTDISGLIAALESAGHRAALVPLGEATANGRTPQAVIDELRARSGATSALPLRGLVYLASQRPEPETWQPDATGPLVEVLALARVLTSVAHGGEAPAPRLWMVTRGAHGPGRASSVEQAPLWGLGRVLALEHPESFGGLIDLGPLEEPPLGAEAWTPLVRELLGSDGEDQVAWRSGARSVARLRPAELDLRSPMRFSLRPDASYLITGGLGFLGLRLASWLVRRGAKRLVLLGRSGLPERGAWGVLPPTHPSRAAVDAVRALEARGAEVRVTRADAADAAAMRALFAELDAVGWPVRGVAHLAGVSSAEPLLALSDAHLATALRPKAAGGVVLHELTRERELDFFLLFSSAAGIWGSSHSGHYAAANLALDALAHRRRALGLPACAIDWGRWPGGGMVSSEVERQYDEVGLEVLPFELAFALMERVCQSGAPQATIARVDWLRFVPILSARRRRPLLELLATQTPRSSDGPVRAAPLAELSALPPAERHRRVLMLVQGHAARVLGADVALVEPDAGLFQLGMNSVMAVELAKALRTDLGVTLPTTAVFENATARALARAVATAAFGASTSEAPPARRLEEPPRTVDATSALDTGSALDALSVHELADLLADKLAS